MGLLRPTPAMYTYIPTETQWAAPLYFGIVKTFNNALIRHFFPLARWYAQEMSLVVSVTRSCFLLENKFKGEFGIWPMCIRWPFDVLVLNPLSVVN